MRYINKSIALWLLFLFLITFVFTFSAQGAVTSVELSVDGESVLYNGDGPVSITASIYDDGLGDLQREVSWGITDPAAGALEPGATQKAMFTPAGTLGPGRWDAVGTTVYAVYEGVRGELPLMVYPKEAKNDPLKKILVYLRSQQRADGFLNDWAIVALATAKENPTGSDWQKESVSHLVYQENYISELKAANNLNAYFKQLTDYARLLLSVAAAAYFDDAWEAKFFNFGGVNLVGEIKAAQDENGHYGKNGEAKLVNSHVWSILALKAAGQSINNIAKARQWLVDCQNTDGGWGYTTDKKDPWGGNLSDSNTTADVVRALVALGDNDKKEDSVLKKALVYLKSNQKSADGGFICNPFWGNDPDGWSDARVIMALVAAGEDPQCPDWSQDDKNKNAVTHLLSLQKPDGSFWYMPGFPAFDPLALAADSLCALTGKTLPAVTPSNPPGGNGGQEAITVTIAVFGLDSAVIYPGQTVSLTGGEKNALDALLKLGADVTFSETYGKSYITGINGLKEKQYGTTSGWCCKVNESEIQVAAKDFLLNDGDKIIWFYVRSVSETGGGSGVTKTEEEKKISPGLNLSWQAKEILDKLTEILGLKQGVTEMGPVEEIKKAVVIVEGEKPLAWRDRLDLKKELEADLVDIGQKVTAGKEALLTEGKGKLALEIPVKALSQDVKISIKEVRQAENTPEIPAGFRQVSSFYEFKPEGVTFIEPATLTLRLAVPPTVNPEKLIFAWYDKANQRWMAIPAVADLTGGLILAKIKHFSLFTILAGEERKTFEDVTASGCKWAKETIEALAGAGIVGGIDQKHFAPERAIARAELAGLLVRALNIPAATGGARFKDIEGNERYAGSVSAAFAAGLVKGYEDGNFRPEQGITREELMVVLVRALSLTASSDEKLPFTDAARISPWAKNSVAAGVARQLVKGYPDGTFRPQEAVTRAECAVMVYRMLES